MLEELRRQTDRLILWAPVAFAVGIFCYFHLLHEPSEAVVWGLIVLATICAAGGVIFHGRDHVLPMVVCAAVALSLLGFSAAALQTRALQTPLLLSKMPAVTVEGVVESIEAGKRSGFRVTIGQVTLERMPRAGLPPQRVRVNSRHVRDIQPGDAVRVRVTLMPPSEPVLPHGFDFQKKSYFDRLGAVGYTLGSFEHVGDREKQTAFSLKVAHLRQLIVQRVNAYLPTEQAGLVNALLTGQKKAVPETMQEDLRHSGLAHLLAISGLHVGMVAGLVFFVVRLVLACIPAVALNYPIKKIAAICAVITVLFYMFLAGATIPTQRAFLMTALVLLAIMLDRTALTLRLVALVALGIMVVNPVSVTGVSFQLSFAAVTALIAFYDGIGRRLLHGGGRRMSFLRKVTVYLSGVVLTSLIAGLATAPFALYYFNQFPVFNVLSNLVAIPVMAFWVMPSALVSLFCMPFSAEEAALQLMASGVDVVLSIAAYISNLPNAVVALATPPVWLFAMIAMAFIVLCLWSGRLRWVALLVLVTGVTVPLWYDPHQVQIRVTRDASSVAVLMPDKSLLLSGPRPERYVWSQWLEDWGLDEDHPAEDWPLCDGYGCGLTVAGRRIVHTHHPLSHQDDCRHADLLIASDPVDVEDCLALEMVVDRYTVWREGAVSLQLHERTGALSKVSVYDTRGVRPWTRQGQVRYLSLDEQS